MNCSPSVCLRSRSCCRFADFLPTLSGDEPPADGREKIGRATVTMIPPPPPRGKKPLPVIEIPKSYVKQARKAGYTEPGAPGVRVNMNPMPVSGRVVLRKHSTGSSHAPSANGSLRRTSPHRSSGRRANSKSPNRSSGRNQHRSSGRRSRSASDQRHSAASNNSYIGGAGAGVTRPGAAATTAAAAELPILSDVSKQAHDYSVGMHPAVASSGEYGNKKSDHFTHIVAGNTGIQAQSASGGGDLQRGTQQRRSRSRKRRPRTDDQSSRETSLSDTGSRDIVVGVPGTNIDSPPTLQMVAPGDKKHASPLAQSSPQTERYRMRPEAALDESSPNELKPRMPYDYYPPQSPGDALAAGAVNAGAKTPRRKTKKAEKFSDPDSNYFTGGSGDQLDNVAKSARADTAQKPRLVFEGVENRAFTSDNAAASGATVQPSVAAASAEAKPKRRRRKSQNRGKNTAGATQSDVQRVQQQAYPNAMLGYSNDSMIYMDEGTDTDKYHISSKSTVKTMTIQKSGETEL